MESFNFTTKVEIPQSKINIDFESNILMLGSCFATEIGECLQDYKFNVLVNPFGVLYNPCSIENSLKRLLSGEEFKNEELIKINPTQQDPFFATFYHHSSFARRLEEEFLCNANTALKNASNFLKKADTIIITLGTAWVYREIKSNIIVSNCHKIDSKNFHRELLTVKECTQTLNSIVNSLPDKNIIFTVSPIRHFKDGANGNQISKSTLLLSINNIVEQAKRNSTNCIIDYFPSYEVMLDELRDYRFYAEDMLHPSTTAVKYIFSRFKETYISPKLYTQMNINLKETKREKHVPNISKQ